MVFQILMHHDMRLWLQTRICEDVTYNMCVAKQKEKWRDPESNGFDDGCKILSYWERRRRKEAWIGLMMVLGGSWWQPAVHGCGYENHNNHIDLPLHIVLVFLFTLLEVIGFIELFIINKRKTKNLFYK